MRETDVALEALAARIEALAPRLGACAPTLEAIAVRIRELGWTKQWEEPDMDERVDTVLEFQDEDQELEDDAADIAGPSAGPWTDDGAKVSIDNDRTVGELHDPAPAAPTLTGSGGGLVTGWMIKRSQHVLAPAGTTEEQLRSAVRNGSTPGGVVLLLDELEIEPARR